MADIFSQNEKFNALSKQSQRRIRRKFNSLSPQGKVTVSQRLNVSLTGAPTKFEQPQTTISAAVEALGEPARMAQRGLQQVAELLPRTRPPQSTARTLGQVARGAFTFQPKALPTQRQQMEALAEIAPGFISPAAAIGGVAGVGARIAGKTVASIAQAVQKTGPFTTAFRTPSVISNKANQRAFRTLDKVKRKLFQEALPEQVDNARLVVQATPKVQQKFLSRVEGLIKDPTTLKQTDNATLMAARDVAGQLQKRGGQFATLARSTNRRIGRILEKRFPGFAAARERVVDIFQATGDPGRPVSLINAVLSAPTRAAEAAKLPGIRRGLGAATGIAAQAAGAVARRGPAIGLTVGSIGNILAEVLKEDGGR